MPRQTKKKKDEDSDEENSEQECGFEDFELIKPDEDLDGQNSWRFPRLYKLDKGGDVRFWEVGFNGKQLITRFGKDGENFKITERPKTIKKNKSGRSLREQALLECRSKDKTQRRNQDYNPNKKDAKYPFQPTLAHSYKPGMLSSKDNPEKIEGNIGIEPKLDGIRAMYQEDEEGNSSFISRHKTAINFQDHLYKYCKKLKEAIPQCDKLDGELIVDGKPFQDTAKAVRCSKNKNTDKDLRTTYHIFDFLPKKNKYTYKERMEMLREAFDKCFGTIYKEKKEKLVPFGIIVISYIKVTKVSEITEYLTMFENIGYEGAVLRNLDMKYVCGRTKDLLKTKNFFDDEAKIIEVLEGKGQMEGAAAKFRVKHRDGMKFKVTMSATLEEKREWFADPKSIIGKRVTYKYQDKSNDDIPRFPIGLAIRDYEGESASDNESEEEEKT